MGNIVETVADDEQTITGAEGEDAATGGAASRDNIGATVTTEFPSHDLELHLSVLCRSINAQLGLARAYFNSGRQTHSLTRRGGRSNTVNARAVYIEQQQQQQRPTIQQQYPTSTIEAAESLQNTCRAVTEYMSVRRSYYNGSGTYEAATKALQRLGRCIVELIERVVIDEAWWPTGRAYYTQALTQAHGKISTCALEHEVSMANADSDRGVAAEQPPALETVGRALQAIMSKTFHYLLYERRRLDAYRLHHISQCKRHAE